MLPLYKCDFGNHKNVWFHVNITITVAVFLQHDQLGNNILLPYD